MNEENADTTEEPLHSIDNAGPVSRETLYELVWAEPMLKVAARFAVSSSYMARVCTILNVPRPERGYWAKLAVGKAPERPALPDPRPGDLLQWIRGSALPERARPVPKPFERRSGRRSRRHAELAEEHHLLAGAKAHFEAGRLSYHGGYLKPRKRLLVDLTVTKTGLDKALRFANELFLALEAKDHRVVIAPHGEHLHRAEVEEREQPGKGQRYSDLWSPMRCTIVYVGEVTIGLTLIELSEEVEARYVNGEYVRLTDLAQKRNSRSQRDYGWTAKHVFPTGRLCLQAFSPYPGTKWTKQWRETPGQDLSGRIAAIVRELEQATAEIVPLIKEAERQAEIARVRWEAQKREWEREAEERRIAQALKDSKKELQELIDSFAAAKSLDAFFADAEDRISKLPEPEREPLTARLQRARELIGNTDALARLASWRTPEER